MAKVKSNSRKRKPIASAEVARPPREPPLGGGTYGAPWYRDRSLVSTTALALISLCAVFVSIYQAVILGQQQRVMAEQQQIMMESARAELWPRIGFGISQSYSRDNLPTQFELLVENAGTGPAIIEDLRMSFDGVDVKNYGELFNAAGLSDTMYTARSNSQISGSIVQAGESRLVMGLNINPPLMQAFVARLQEGGKWNLDVCYRSVFGDYYQVKTELYSGGPGNTDAVSACGLGDGVKFEE